MPTGIYKRTKYHLEILDRAREAAIGIPHPNKAKQMIGKGNHFYGKKHSEESKAKISENRKGISAWNKGFTKETSEGVRRAAKAKTGKPRPDHVQKILRKARLGKIPWNKGKKCPQLSGKNNPMYGICGRDAPNFIDGASYEPYPPEFNIGLCRKIRKRDNYICQLCEKSEQEEKEEINRVLSVHHIDYNKQNCNESNLITLCGKCNSKVNYNRVKWTEYFNKFMSNN